ncbi:DUF3455 domain-containing protein [Actinoplanes sp. NPDC023936]|uniref:DUF3455 domain-containing protein n=1 Tax=Actinoplanes sp. NPDC023936 TaxID=3154910 RepID=UPI0033E9A5B3
MTRRLVKIFGTFGAIALVAVAAPASVSFAATEGMPATAAPAAARAGHVSAGTVSGDTVSAGTVPGGSVSAGGAPAGAPRVPPELAPPPGHVVNSVLKARGVQIYGCTAGAWTLIEPAASLTGMRLRPQKKVTALHYRGPTWQSDQDGSLVEGDGASAVRAPSAHPDSIPQLRITAKATRGAGVFGEVTYIQRLDTVGGIAPAGSCSGSATTAVPYRAVYRFFVAKS